MKKLILISMAAALVACGPKENSSARHLESSTVAYQQDGKDFEGFIAYPKKTDKKLPAILVIHEWDGLGEYAKMRAKMLAENGYFAFAMDMYGKGIRAKDHKEAGELSGTYGKDRKLMRSRLETALAFLKARPEIDPTKIVVMGYCFGGLAALETGLMGADVKGIAAFHAALAFPTIAADAKNVKGPVLIHHGGADKFIPPKDIQTLKTEFDKAKVKYQFIVHEGAVHGFTNKFNDPIHKEHGMAYDAKADLASWASLLSFLRQNLN
jgi:dienelactone hydrolase